MFEILFYVGVPYLLIGVLFTTIFVLPITNGQAPLLDYVTTALFWPKVLWECFRD